MSKNEQEKKNWIVGGILLSFIAVGIGMFVWAISYFV